MIEEIMKEYNIIRLADDYYRTSGGRAYIKADGNAFKIYSCNGNYVGVADDFRTACIKAHEV